MEKILELKDIKKIYGDGESKLTALKIHELKVETGEFLTIVGPSGSGKSTLLNIISLVDKPTEGSITYFEKAIYSMKNAEMSKYRREEIGYIFQAFNLLQHLTALENVMLPLIPYESIKTLKDKAVKILNSVGLATRINHYPSQLSGGEQQRVAIARSLVNSPKLIIGDEPTGNLDTHNRNEIINILKDINSNGVTIILATHDVEVAKSSKRTIYMRDGEILKEEILQ